MASSNVSLASNAKNGSSEYETPDPDDKDEDYYNRTKGKQKRTKSKPDPLLYDHSDEWLNLFQRLPGEKRIRRVPEEMTPQQALQLLRNDPYNAGIFSLHAQEKVMEGVEIEFAAQEAKSKSSGDVVVNVSICKCSFFTVFRPEGLAVVFNMESFSSLPTVLEEFLLEKSNKFVVLTSLSSLCRQFPRLMALQFAVDLSELLDEIQEKDLVPGIKGIHQGNIKALFVALFKTPIVLDENDVIDCCAQQACAIFDIFVFTQNPQCKEAYEKQKISSDYIWVQKDIPKSLSSSIDSIGSAPSSVAPKMAPKEKAPEKFSKFIGSTGSRMRSFTRERPTSTKGKPESLLSGISDLATSSKGPQHHPPPNFLPNTGSGSKFAMQDVRTQNLDARYDELVSRMLKNFEKVFRNNPGLSFASAHMVFFEPYKREFRSRFYYPKREQADQREEYMLDCLKSTWLELKRNLRHVLGLQRKFDW